MAKNEINKKKAGGAGSKLNQTKSSQAGYAGQDFEQGRNGLQGGHTTTTSDPFPQFENAGQGGFAGEKVPGTTPGKE